MPGKESTAITLEAPLGKGVAADNAATTLDLAASSWETIDEYVASSVAVGRLYSSVAVAMEMPSEGAVLVVVVVVVEAGVASHAVMV